MGKDKAKNGSGNENCEKADENTATDPSQIPATVHFFDSSKHVFYVPKKADGAALFDKVIKHLGINEKDYFALSYKDDDGNRHWIYDDKKISKQLKGHPWVFNFEVKFYPTDPVTLNDDITRHYLCLQVRHDISSGKLPAMLATHALLGSYVAQSTGGDYSPSAQYIDFLKNCRLSPMPSEKLYERVEELHKQQKQVGCFYVVKVFQDGKNTPVQIGVHAQGINIYRDQIRIHRFLWQNIIKVAYRRNIFIVKVKPGELDKNESTAAFKLPDYEAAKRVWKSAVEHHTFFRLIQPEDKPHKGLFRWGSAKFRYQGRTQFQSKMASQALTNQAPVQRSQSARLERNGDDAAISSIKNQTLPADYGKDGGKHDIVGVSSNFSSVDANEWILKKDNEALMNDTEVGDSKAHYVSGSPNRVHDQHSTVTVTTTSTTITTGSTSVARSPLGVASYSTEHNEKVVSPDKKTTIVAEKTVSPKQFVTDIKTRRRIEGIGVEDKAIVYHPGHYEIESLKNRVGPPNEPPVEPGDDLVFIHDKKLKADGKIYHPNGSQTNFLLDEKEIASVFETSPKVEIPYEPLRTKFSIPHCQLLPQKTVNESQNANSSFSDGIDKVINSDTQRDARYSVKASLKQPTREARQTEFSNEQPPAFKLKGVHLRGPPSIPEDAPKNTSSETASKPIVQTTLPINRDGLLAAGVEEQKAIVEDSSKSHAVSKSKTSDEKLINQQKSVSGSEAKMIDGKDGHGGGFFSFLKGHKSRKSNKRGKTANDITPASGLTSTIGSNNEQNLHKTSPTEELQYKTLVAKIGVSNHGTPGIVGQIERQVTQDIAKASLSDKKRQKSVETSEIEAVGKSAIDPVEREVIQVLKYDEANMDDRMVFEKTETYHLKGIGKPPKIDISRSSLNDTLKQYGKQKKGDSHIKSIETSVVEKKHGNVPHEIVAESLPDTILESKREVITGPETVITDVDEHGNVIKRTIKTQQIKHTVQRQVQQVYGVSSEHEHPEFHVVEKTHKSITPLANKTLESGNDTKILETRNRTLVCESKDGVNANGAEYPDLPGELISCQTITKGNRTIETLTYKTEVNGVVETHVEHRVTIHSGENIDHDAELSQAILEATNMNPDMTVEKIEVKQESQC